MTIFLDEGRPLITADELQTLIEADKDGTIGSLWETMLAVAMQDADAINAEYARDPMALAGPSRTSSCCARISSSLVRWPTSAYDGCLPFDRSTDPASTRRRSGRPA